MIQGTVKWFNRIRGFGFIIIDGEVNHDIFVHYSQINQKGYKSLDEGDSVEFDLVHTSHGDQAHNVSRINVMQH